MSDKLERWVEDTAEEIKSHISETRECFVYESYLSEVIVKHYTSEAERVRRLESLCRHEVIPALKATGVNVSLAEDVEQALVRDQGSS